MNYCLTPSGKLLLDEKIKYYKDMHSFLLKGKDDGLTNKL